MSIGARLVVLLSSMGDVLPENFPDRKTNGSGTELQYWYILVGRGYRRAGFAPLRRAKAGEDARPTKNGKR
jgi:hypothetical protein